MKNKITTIILLMIVISSIGIVQGATITTEIKDHLVTISVSSDDEKWGAYISSDIDHDNGQSGDSEQYLYFVERVVGVGNVEFKRMYPAGNYLVSLYVDGDLVDFSEFSFVPDPILTPTPTPTPEPTPSPTPTPEPTPAPTEAPHSHSSGGGNTEQIDFSSFGTYSDDATLSFNSSPARAMVYINKQKLGETPILRDVAAGRYRIEMKLAGYEVYQQDINPDEGEVKKINVKLEPLVIESEPINVTLPVVPQIIVNDTSNDTVATTTATTNDSIPVLFYVMSLVAMIVAVVGLGIVRKKSKQSKANQVIENIDTSVPGKIKEIFRIEGKVDNETLAKKIDVDIRTIQRGIKILKEEGYNI